MDHTEGPALMPLDDPEDGSVLIDPDLLPILERVRWGRKRKPNGDLIGMGNVYSLDWSANYILPRLADPLHSLRLPARFEDRGPAASRQVIAHGLSARRVKRNSADNPRW